MFHKNTYSTVRHVSIHNLDGECNTNGEEFYSFCEITYEFKTKRPKTPKINLSQYGSLKIPEKLKEQKTQYAPKELIPEIDKVKIPTKTTAFNGPISIIENETNMSFGAEYKYLDGEGLVDIKLHDLDGNTILDLNTDAANKKAKLTYTINGKEHSIEYKVKINRKIWQRWQIKLFDKNTKIYLNNTEIFSIPLKVKTGYFSMTTNGTHIEKRHTYIQDLKTGKRINFPLLEDPCKLRLVYREDLYSGNITIDSEKERIFENNFTLNTYFDYGKVKVSVNGSSNTNNTALETQFWMVRT